MDIDFKEVGERLSRRRKILGLKQAEVCERCGISDKYLSNIECARSVPSIDVLVRICNVLETTPDAILLGIHRKTTPDIEEEAIEEYGMLGISKECDCKLKLKEGFSESLDEITNEIDNYCNSFRKLSKLKANRPSFDSDSDNGAYAMYIVSDSINIGVSSLKHSLTIDAADDDSPFFTEYLTCESLLHVLYYFLYQNALHDWYSYSICVNCSKRFLASNRKKIDNLCPECIKRNRIVRNKEQQRGNPKQYFREIINNRAYWYYGKDIYNDVIKTWLAAFNRQHAEMKQKSDYEFDLWKDAINKEWKKIIKAYKACHTEVK